MNRMKLLVGSVVLLASTLAARADTAIPVDTDFTTKITAVGGVVGAAAAIGFSVWAYRKTKAKAGQAIG